MRGFHQRARVGATTRSNEDNLIIHADNLVALQALATTHEARFQCIYLDPPYNTGHLFEQYRDALHPDVWREAFRLRLQACLPLLNATGSVFIHIGDTELGTVIELGDAIYGRENRLSIITVRRGAATGHKVQNKGVVNVTDYLVWYARDRKAARVHPQRTPRLGRDKAYGTWLEGDLDGAFSLAPVAKVFAQQRGATSSGALKQSLGPDEYEREISKFLLTYATRVIRFAEPRFEAIGQRAQAAVLASRAQPERVIKLMRPERAPLILLKGKRILFLADKVEATREGPRITEPLTNVWTDIPVQGIAAEGGVRFIRNKKPEALILRILQLCTAPGDWVLDPYLGSGTVAAVAHKAERKYVGIEEGDHLDTLCVPRLTRVVGGQDSRGVSRLLNFEGGGGFRVLERNR